MKSFGKKPESLRLERMKASLLWAEEGVRNIYPIPRGFLWAVLPHTAQHCFPRSIATLAG